VCDRRVFVNLEIMTNLFFLSSIPTMLVSLDIGGRSKDGNDDFLLLTNHF